MVLTVAMEDAHFEISSSESEEWVSTDDGDDDSGDDPTFDVVQEAGTALFQLSVGTVSGSGGVGVVDLGSDEEVPVECDVEVPKLNADDEQRFEIVAKIVVGGQFGKLKLDDCKLYLRKYGLRLTGKKDVLIARIKEHHSIKDGGGEGKYPISSFVVNCKGDACTGDIVLFKQVVYDMYSKVTRSAVGAPCGERMVAGRIVKESYGAAKQQHTFTIEVLWSKGVKPLPPLHPLLIKGRNLYKMQTRRQRWPDEVERKKVILDKHTRGNLARFSREERLQKKQLRTLGKIRRNARVSDEVLQAIARSVDTTKMRGGQNQNISHTSASLNARAKEPVSSQVSKQHNIHHQQRPNHHSWQKYRVPGGPQYCHSSPFLNYNPPLPPGQPIPNSNRFSTGVWQREQRPTRCRYYQQGRCRYGDACRWLHD